MLAVQSRKSNSMDSSTLLGFVAYHDQLPFNEQIHRTSPRYDRPSGVNMTRNHIQTNSSTKKKFRLDITKQITRYEEDLPLTYLTGHILVLILSATRNAQRTPDPMRSKQASKIWKVDLS